MNFLNGPNEMQKVTTNKRTGFHSTFRMKEQPLTRRPSDDTPVAGVSRKPVSREVSVTAFLAEEPNDDVKVISDVMSPAGV